jgi:putative Mn2+ efflux pump MntP
MRTGRRLDLRQLAVLAIATSIDALAVGVTLAFLPVSIGWSILLIGVTTAVLTFVGVLVGRRVGARFGKPAEIAGGVILILIGVSIVLEHTGVLG